MKHDTSPPSAPLHFFTFMMFLVPITNWEPHGVTLTGYCYVMRHGIKVQIITLYRVSHLEHYSVTESGNVTSVYPPSVNSPISTKPTDSQLKCTTHNICCIYTRTLLPPDDGQLASPKHIEVCRCRLGLRSQGYHPVAPRPIAAGPSCCAI
jgi:hypothetical protein